MKILKPYRSWEIKMQKFNRKKRYLTWIFMSFSVFFLAATVFAGSITYTYDDAGRLTMADYGEGKSISYTYDDNGNLLQREVQGSESTTYTLTVNQGSGSGQYAQGTVVDISADNPSAGKEFDQWTGDTEHVADMNAAETSVTLPAEDVTVTATYRNLIMDNDDPGTQAAGEWFASGVQPSIGTNSLYTREPGATYTFERTLTGCYNLSMWWPEHPTRHTEIPVQIYDGEQLISDLTINQQIKGGQWNPLLTHEFTTNARVVIISASDTYATVADAVRFEAADCSRVFDRMEVQGQSQMDEESTQFLDLRVFYTNGTDELVRADSWSVGLAGADITDQGVLTAPSVDRDELCTITATHTDFEGTQHTTTFDVIISDDVVTDLIMDDGTNKTTSTGKWLPSGLQPTVGDNAMYSRETGATYTYETSLNGCYEISIWWTEHPTRYDKVPVKIYDGEQLIHTVVINQQTGGGKWNILGTWEFTTSGRVVIFSESSNHSTCADAVRYKASDCTITDLIMDNGDPGTLADGEWLPSGLQPSTGTDSMYSKALGAAYTYEIPLKGCHKISLWWTQHPTRFNDVPVDIYDGETLVKSLSINQQINGGMWNALGTYDFENSAKVGIWSVSQTHSTNADAARFEAADCSQIPDITDLTLDNTDPETLSSGIWYTSGLQPSYGPDSEYSKEINATYTYQATLTGPYQVSIWWTEHPTRFNAVPIEIYAGNQLLQTVVVNQQADGGQWNSLGTHEFSGSARVVIYSESDTYSTNADAVRFELMEE
jgi:YD repeat-containing protein